MNEGRALSTVRYRNVKVLRMVTSIPTQKIALAIGPSHRADLRPADTDTIVVRGIVRNHESRYHTPPLFRAARQVRVAPFD